MNKLLMIAYLFPPAGDVGVYRTLKFAKYLPSYGWQPVVLTPRNGKFANYDESLLELIPQGTTVHRTWSFEAFNDGLNRKSSGGPRRSFWDRVYKRICYYWSYVTVPDNRVFWVRTAVRKARRIIRDEGIRHVYISGKPFSAFLVGSILKKTENVRVLIDYRDPWTQNLNYYRRSPLHTWIEKRMERRVVQRSDVVIANTRVNEQNMVDEFGAGQPRDKFITIHNGFDEEDFSPASVDGSERFTITYAGVFYYSIGSDYKKSAGDSVMKTYSPLYFFEALERLFLRRPELKDRIRANFMGLLGHGYDPLIRELGLEDVVNRIGYVGYDEHIRVLKNSTALLLVLSRGEKSKGWVPSKFFQYMGSGNPILALVPEGEVKKIIESTHAGVCVEPDDVDGIAGAIERLYESFAGGDHSFKRDDKEVKKYTRKYQTGLLVRALEGLER